MTKPVGRLKCDACGHLEAPAELSDSMVDTPCPKCGANMLTRGDYESTMMMHAMAMPLLAMLGCVAPPADYKGPVVRVNFTTGEVELEERRDG